MYNNIKYASPTSPRRANLKLRPDANAMPAGTGTAPAQTCRHRLVLLLALLLLPTDSRTPRSFSPGAPVAAAEPPEEPPLLDELVRAVPATATAGLEAFAQSRGLPVTGVARPELLRLAAASLDQERTTAAGGGGLTAALQAAEAVGLGSDEVDALFAAGGLSWVRLGTAVRAATTGSGSGSGSGGGAESCATTTNRERGAAAGRQYLAAEGRRRSRLYLQELSDHFDAAFAILTAAEKAPPPPAGGDRSLQGRPGRGLLTAPERDLPPLSAARRLEWGPRQKVKLRQVLWNVKQTIISAAELASSGSGAGGEHALVNLWALAAIKLHHVRRIPSKPAYARSLYGSGCCTCILRYYILKVPPNHGCPHAGGAALRQDGEYPGAGQAEGGDLCIRGRGAGAAALQHDRWAHRGAGAGGAVPGVPGRRRARRLARRARAGLGRCLGRRRRRRGGLCGGGGARGRRANRYRQQQRGGRRTGTVRT
eukprot:SAG22_NODE_14_length_33165_cov_13.196698_20_plen_482_part_00